ncbi:ribosome maturation factor RimP [Wenzhouxiangella sp. XN24]|uniref:ribosome maturation factor RimP n=1 Tax=Wenzhouxiangella sp. XN24 TaxID=2713569 RepID=UPI003211E77B
MGRRAHFLLGEAVMLKDTLLELLGPEIEAMGYELVELDAPAPGGSGTLRIYIDGDNGIGLEDCERVSHRVSGVLDVEDPIHGHYILEVSSPGLDRPLRTEQHFRSQAGKLVKIVLAAGRPGRRRYKGTIVGIDDGIVEIEVDGERFSLSLSDIESARLVPEY